MTCPGAAADTDQSGSVVAALHRGWMSLKDALSVSEARRSWTSRRRVKTMPSTSSTRRWEQDISAGLREAVQCQAVEISAARDSIANLAASHA